MRTAQRRKLKIDPSAFYRAWQGISMTDAGVPKTVGRGARLRGDHVLVQQFGGEAFVEDDLPEHEWPTAFDDLVAASEERAVEEAVAARAAEAAKESIIPKDTPAGALLVCTQGVISSAAGPCPEGSLVLASDPRVRLAPEAFTPLLVALPMG